MATTPFFQVEGPDDPELVTGLKRLVMLDASELGRVRAQFRTAPTARPMAVVLVVSVILAALALLIPWGPDGTNLAVAVIVCMAPLTYFLIVLTGLATRHWVRERGLATGWRRRTRLTVPWETIDPGRVHVVENATAVVFHPDFQDRSPTYLNNLSDRALLVCGFNSATGDPLFRYWLLGTPDPEGLAQQIERAMVDAGLEARGLAANASRTAVRARYRNGGTALLSDHRGPYDPVLGAPSPG
ncbi:hypothetical protein KIH74_07060 [Kineosporia sp. J2-2]|uniref:PH domain-containing protein n=1 Tax=Kineosporia corallincola TaxID=2835133 RepID=A0ABS5TC68_9ACTN|nr:hypothetical protein [Kineosporia corallincola]MBT0768679.1 hypothetical protein [Kineosporia corallincola]